MINVTVRPYTKRGVANAWEIDLTIAFPDGLPPMRIRKKSPMKTQRQSSDWGHRLGVELSKQGRPGKRAVGDSPVVPRVITFGELVKEYMSRWVEDQELASGTKLTYERQLYKYFVPIWGDLALDLITTDRVSEIRASLRTKENGEKRSASHRNYLMEMLSRLFDKAVEWKLLQKAPQIPDRLKVPRQEIEIFSADELSRLLDVAKESTRLIVLLGVDAGLRVGEMLGLRWSDLDLKEGRLVVRQQLTTENKIEPPKGGEPRTIPLTPRLQAALLDGRHLNERVLWMGDAPMTRARLTAALRSAERRAKLIAMRSPHKLRHTFASRLLGLGADLKSVQALLGHKSLQTTLVYLHLQTGGVERAIGLLAGDQLETKERGVER